VTVRVPADARPGIYKGAVRLRGAFDADVGVRLRVWPFTLPDKPALRSIAVLRMHGIRGVQASGASSALSDDAWWDKFFALCSSYGQMPGLYIVNQLEGVDWVKVRPDHTVSLDFRPLDKLIRKLEEAGHGDSIQTVPPHNLRRRGPDRRRVLSPWHGLQPLTPEFDKAFGDYLRQMEARLDAAGRLESTEVYLWDEPSNPREIAQFRQILELAEKSAPRLLKAVGGRGAPYPELYGLIDDWTVHMRWLHVDEATRRRVRERRAAGDEVGGYGNNRYYLDMPLIFMRLWPWVLKREGMTSTGWWSVNEWSSNPWEEVKKQGGGGSRVGAGCLIYPPRNADEPISASLRLEALRDGMEDYAYLRLLEQSLRRDAARRGSMTVAQADAYAAEQVRDYVVKLTWGCMESQWRNEPRLLQQVRSEVARKIVELQP
jgi:hypothetical protein